MKAKTFRIHLADGRKFDCIAPDPDKARSDIIKYLFPEKVIIQKIKPLKTTGGVKHRA